MVSMHVGVHQVLQLESQLVHQNGVSLGQLDDGVNNDSLSRALVRQEVGVGVAPTIEQLPHERPSSKGAHAGHVDDSPAKQILGQNQDSISNNGYFILIFSQRELQTIYQT